MAGDAAVVVPGEDARASSSGSASGARRDSTQQNIALLVERLTARSEEIAERMLDAYRREITAYAEADEAIAHEIQQYSRLAALVSINCIRDNKVLDGAALDVLREGGRRRYEQGFPLEAMIQAYQIGARVVWSEALDETRELDPLERADVLEHVSRITFALVAQLSLTVSEAYHEAQRLDEARRRAAHRDLIEELLEGGESSEALRTRAKSVELQLGYRHVVVVVQAAATPDEGGVRATLESIAGKLIEETSLPGRPSATIRGSTLALLVPEQDGRDVAVACRKVLSGGADHIRAGVGRSEPGVHGIAASYRQALAVVSLLRRSPALGRALSYEESLPYALLRAQPELAIDAFRSTLQPMLERGTDTFSELRKTLEVVLDTGGNLVEASKRLHVHRQTLYTRLERIKTLTGLDLDRREDRLLAELGLRALALMPDEVTEASR